MNNSSFNQNDESVLQQIDKITKLRVELAKQQSKIQSFKELQQNWKTNGIKTQALYRQTLFFQRKLNDYNKKIIQITKILNIGNQNQQYPTPKFLDNSSQSFSFENNDSSYKRNMTRLNSLRSIAKFNSEEQQTQITDQQPKLNLILQSVIHLQKDNEQLQQNLKFYEQSCSKIERINSHQKYLKQQFESLLRQKQAQIQQKELEIKNTLKQLKSKHTEINQLSNVVSELKAINSSLKQQNTSLYDKLTQKQEQPSSSLQAKQAEVRQKCQNLLKMLKVNEDEYLRSYLGSISRFKFDNVQSASNRKSKYELIFD